MMIAPETLQAAIDAVAADGKPNRIMLFGSYARGDARDDSDVDLLVIEDEVSDRAREMVRLRRLLRPLRVPADILVLLGRRGDTLGRSTGVGALLGLA